MSFVQPSSYLWLTDASLNSSILSQGGQKKKPRPKLKGEY